MAWVPEHGISGVRWPIIRFVQITALATVEQIGRIIGTTAELRMIMVDRQLTARVRFGHPAVLTDKIGPLPYVQTQLH
jgi:hypothetical protein